MLGFRVEEHVVGNVVKCENRKRISWRARANRMNSRAKVRVYYISTLRPCRQPVACWLVGCLLFGFLFLFFYMSLRLLARWFLDVGFRFFVRTIKNYETAVAFLCPEQSFGLQG